MDRSNSPLPLLLSDDDAAQFTSRELDASSTPSIHTFTRANVIKPSRIDVPSSTSSRSTFQPQIQPRKINVTPPVRRKPLPPGSSVASPASAKTASPVGGLGNGTALPSTGIESSSQNKRFKSSPPPAPRIPWLPQPSSSPKLILRDLDQFPRGLSPLIPQSPGQAAFPNLSPDQARKALQDLDNNGYIPDDHDYVRTVKLQPPRPPETPQIKPRELGQQQALPPKAPKMPFQSRAGPPPLQLRGDLDMHTQPSQFHESRNGPKPSMLTSFFGWKPSASSPTAESSPTTISDRSHSPQPSSHSPSPHSLTSSIKSIPQAIDVPKANAPIQSSYLPNGSQLPTETSPVVAAQLEEMEQELREISSELAGSIRREIDLEEQIDHLQSGEPPPDFNRRTSDYFSDSGTSSVRYPPSDIGGTKAEDLDKKWKKMDQEKAQARLDFSQRLQDERGKRKVLEVHVRGLQEHIATLEQGQHYSSNAPTQELEAALEDSRRRLHEERQLKENFQDLLSALQGDLEKHRNERDNLRDEVVPQLQARVEGLEAEAAEFQNLTYEHTRMQQELDYLKKENTRLLQDMQRSPRISTIAEEGWSSPTGTTMKTGLSRSASLARGTSSAGGLNKSVSLSRSNSLSKEQESRESLSERVKDIEKQRDALHSALKSLLDRQKHQTREHAKRVKSLEQEKERALETQSPRRKGYEKEVKSLRLEVNQLRKRAEEAITQKWQCENGLTGLKKDLDRAEQETGSLRSLLQAHDILIPEFPDRSSQSKEQISSSSLEQAYQELQVAQALTVARLRNLKVDMPTGHEDTETEETMNQLLKTMTDAERERVNAQREAELYRAQARSLEESKSFHEGENANLAEQLKASANRVDSLATQVRSQLESNSSLRSRLAEAVGRGEKEQKASAMRISQMQGKLKSLEDRLMVAQQHSEEAVQMHEEEVQEIRDADNSQLQRLKNGLRSPSVPNMMSIKSPKSPLSPFYLGGSRSPRGSDKALNMRMNEALRTEYLERRVVELEAALREADIEMQEVVEKMNKAQIDVMDLQTARDDAIRQTKALQSQIQAESAKMGSLMRFMPTSMTSTS